MDNGEFPESEIDFEELLLPGDWLTCRFRARVRSTGQRICLRRLGAGVLKRCDDLSYSECMKIPF